jgi:hypothetical protein
VACPANEPQNSLPHGDIYKLSICPLRTGVLDIDEQAVVDGRCSTDDVLSMLDYFNIDPDPAVRRMTNRYADVTDAMARASRGFPTTFSPLSCCAGDARHCPAWLDRSR